ncbi:hypothetical protein SEA_LIFESAVOR_93 [Mycobacterium phage LifeSavor]|uniref:Uncharacterized protein n=7 Tax=Bixzunavirus TaxID=680114 RepID=T2FH79_9CAUD|nr:hypothetical protein AWH68_gp230 [Mycobacterium phage Breeniome]AGV99574.1 hypothetical protein PBI_BREENIOME_94 [Mycobacterium phage Breeniome]AVI04692.1 hypothetical protein SEA_LIFESAVOR_93 [Mycobacterium phage LifeSavor]
MEDTVMPIIRNISYHTIQTHHADEAESLAFYLNEHGVCAQAKGDAIDVPVPDRETFDKVEKLKETWEMFWETSDSGLFGLPLYVKEG